MGGLKEYLLNENAEKIFTKFLDTAEDGMSRLLSFLPHYINDKKSIPAIKQDWNKLWDKISKLT